MQTIEKKEYRFANDLGDAELTVYEVFPGVELVYSSVHMDRFDPGNVLEGTMIEIHHCREGRIEQEFEEEYFYLMPGDFCIALRKTIPIWKSQSFSITFGGVQTLDTMLADLEGALLN